jgi:hypothetical protein
VDRAYNDSYAIVTYPDRDHSLIGDVSSLLLDKGAALEGGEPLMKTTPMSWIDTDNNGRITKREILGKYTVLSHEEMGKGEVIVLSDPSIFINAMVSSGERWGNRKFLENLTLMDDKLLVDLTGTRIADADGYSMVMMNLRNSPLMTLIFISLLLFCLLIQGWRKNE